MAVGDVSVATCRNLDQGLLEIVPTAAAVPSGCQLHRCGKTAGGAIGVVDRGIACAWDGSVEGQVRKIRQQTWHAGAVAE